MFFTPIETFIARLRVLKTPAVHLVVGKGNQGAVRFYARCGFHVIKEYETGIVCGQIGTAQPEVTS